MACKDGLCQEGDGDCDVSKLRFYSLVLTLRDCLVSFEDHPKIFSLPCILGPFTLSQVRMDKLHPISLRHRKEDNIGSSILLNSNIV